MKPTFEEIQQAFACSDWPVWWDSGDNRPAGQHRARIIDIKPYTGRYDFVACIFEFPSTTGSRRPIGMTISFTDIIHELKKNWPSKYGELKD